VRIALRGRECFLLLPAETDYFALPPIGRDVDYDGDIAPMIRDMAVLLTVAHLIARIGPDTPDQPAADDDTADGAQPAS